MLMLLCGTVAAQAAPFVYKDGGRRDPFWPLVNSSGGIISYNKSLTMSDMSLQGIMLGTGEDNAAIVNGMIVKKGDKIGVFTVKRITANSVIFEKDKKEFILKLKKED